MGSRYIVLNGPMPAAASPAKVATGATIKTLLQIKPAVPILIKEWGISFDASAAAVPGVVELAECDAAATVTAFVAADVMPYDLNAPANSAGTGGTPLNLGTAASGYTSSNENTVASTRVADEQLVAPTNQHWKQWPLGDEFVVAVGKFLRVRVTFPVTVNALCYVRFEV